MKEIRVITIRDLGKSIGVKNLHRKLYELNWLWIDYAGKYRANRTVVRRGFLYVTHKTGFDKNGVTRDNIKIWVTEKGVEEIIKLLCD